MAQIGSGSRGVVWFALVTCSPQMSPVLSQTEASWCVSALLQVDYFYIHLLACSQIICPHGTNLISKYCPIGDLNILLFQRVS